MGWLFGSSAEDVTKAKKKLRSILETNDYIYFAVQDILIRAEKGEKWITECQGYYDSRKREVYFDKDLVGIFWFTEKTVKDNAGNLHKEKEKLKDLAYSPTRNGYKPLHDFTDKDTMATLSVEDVLKVFADVFRDEMKKNMPTCKFGEVGRLNGEIMFSYSVPALDWKDWF